MREKILSYIEKVPALSPTIAKIVELSGSQATSAGDLVGVIKLDPTLTAKILKLINSSYFGMPQQISSINRAIVLLGFNTIKNLALSAEVLSSFDPGTGAAFSVDKFWEHSLACAVACKLLAQRLVKEIQKQEEFFIAGLIHDIGKIFLIKYFAKNYFALVEQAVSSKDFFDREKKFFTMEHAEIGGLISEKWGLSKDLVLSIRAHHKPLNEREDSLMASIVFLSNMYCKSRGFSDNIEDFIFLAPNEEEWALLNLSLEESEEIFSALDEKIEEAKVFIKVGKTKP